MHNQVSEIRDFLRFNNTPCPLCYAEEFATLSTIDKHDLGLQTAGLERVIHAGHNLLGLIRFLTAGPKEARAWTIKKGDNARDAAGGIHSDMARGFICAETISFEDFVACDGETGAKTAGKMRQEGAEYAVQEADVILFRFNV